MQFFVSLVLISLTFVLFLLAKKPKYSDQFIQELDILGRACLEYYDVTPNASSLLPAELYRALNGENERGLHYLPKNFGRHIKFNIDSIRGPRMELIEICFRNSEVILIVNDSKANPRESAIGIDSINALRVRSRN